MLPATWRLETVAQPSQTVKPRSLLYLIHPNPYSEELLLTRRWKSECVHAFVCARVCVCVCVCECTHMLDRAGLSFSHSNLHGGFMYLDNVITLCNSAPLPTPSTEVEIISLSIQSLSLSLFNFLVRSLFTSALWVNHIELTAILLMCFFEDFSCSSTTNCSLWGRDLGSG